MVSRFARDERWLDRAGARDAYLAQLGKALEKSDAEVLAYCLMSNHVHLVVIQGNTPLSRLMKSVHTGFAGWVRRSVRAKKALGPVFAGRPRMLLVDREEYLLALVRYVHNNPVRAKLVQRARGSSWSSHAAYVGRAEAPVWLRTGYVLERFGKQARTARARFDEFVDAARDATRRIELSGAGDAAEAAAARRALGDGHRLSDGIMGSDEFVERMRTDVERIGAALSSRGIERRPGAAGRPALRQVIDAVLLHLKVDPIDLQVRPRARRCAEAKRLATWMWIHDYEGQQIEVARELGMDTSVVSRHYGHAVAAAGTYDELASAVRAGLESRGRRRPGRRTRSNADPVPVRFHVDVDET